MCLLFKDGKNKKQLLVFLIGIYDDDPEIITLDRGEFGKFEVNSCLFDNMATQSKNLYILRCISVDFYYVPNKKIIVT